MWFPPWMPKTRNRTETYKKPSGFSKNLRLPWTRLQGLLPLRGRGGWRTSKPQLVRPDTKGRTLLLGCGEDLENPKRSTRAGWEDSRCCTQCSNVSSVCLSVCLQNCAKTLASPESFLPCMNKLRPLHKIQIKCFLVLTDAAEMTRHNHIFDILLMVLGIQPHKRGGCCCQFASRRFVCWLNLERYGSPRDCWKNSVLFLCVR